VTDSAQPTTTPVVGIHGIGNYHYLAEAGSVAAAAGEISADWTRGVAAGLAVIGARTPPPEVRVAYYSHLLHRGTPQGDVDPAYLDDEAQDLLIAWVEQLLPAPEPSIAQGERTARARAAADWLTRHLGRSACRGAIGFCREVSTYLSKPARRQAVCDAVAETLAAGRPRVVIAHSLGSVVAYEALWQSSPTGIDLLLTLGSPLAIPGAIFDRLDPAPVNGRGARPPSVAHWVNLADVGDFVAIPRAGLSSRFDGLDYDNPAIVIDEREFHGIEPYLACPDTAEILAPYLRGDR
jgi:hypothetical protein